MNEFVDFKYVTNQKCNFFVSMIPYEPVYKINSLFSS